MIFVPFIFLAFAIAFVLIGVFGITFLSMETVTLLTMTFIILTALSYVFISDKIKKRRMH